MNYQHRITITLFIIFMIACPSSVSLNELQIKIWQPEGQDVFSESNSVHLLTTTAQGIHFESEAQSLSELNSDLESLTPSDTPLDFILTIKNSNEIYLGYIEAHQVHWPSDTMEAKQKEALMFVGPPNKTVPLTNGYPPSLTRTVACQASNGALVLGSSLEQTTNSQVETYYMDLENRTLKAGPVIANITTDAKCTLDANNNVYIYGGCNGTNPFGGLLRTTLETSTDIELLLNSTERNSCDTDLQATNEKIWLVDGVNVELRNLDGSLVDELELSTEGPYRLALDKSLNSNQIWLWHTNNNSQPALVLLEHIDSAWALKEVSLEGSLLHVGHDRNGKVKVLTTEGLYDLRENDEPNLILDAPLIFDNRFQPETFIESQPERWVFLNAEGTVLRMIEGSANKDIIVEYPTPHAQLFRGPSGAIFIAGGTSSGIHLLITDSF